MKTIGTNKTNGVNKEFDKYVEYRLENWADWFGTGDNNGLGYPSRTIEHRLMTEGIVVRQTGRIIIPDNSEAEEIENYVKELWTVNENLAIALRVYYYGKRKTVATKVNLQSTTFKKNVGMAKYWVAGKLTDSYALRSIG